MKRARWGVCRAAHRSRATSERVNHRSRGRRLRRQYHGGDGRQWSVFAMPITDCRAQNLKITSRRRRRLDCGICSAVACGYVRQLLVAPPRGEIANVVSRILRGSGMRQMFGSVGHKHVRYQWRWARAEGVCFWPRYAASFASAPLRSCSGQPVRTRAAPSRMSHCPRARSR